MKVHNVDFGRELTRVTFEISKIIHYSKTGCNYLSVHVRSGDMARLVCLVIQPPAQRAWLDAFLLLKLIAEIKRSTRVKSNSEAFKSLKSSTIAYRNHFASSLHLAISFSGLG